FACAVDTTRRPRAAREAQQMEYIAFDAHKHSTLASVARPDGQLVREQRIAHERGALQQFLERWERGSPVGVASRGLIHPSPTGPRQTFWIPPGELRDQRDLPRTRMVLVRQRTQLKNRIHATLAKDALHDLEVSDLFGARGRALLRQRLELLPPCTAYTTQHLLEQVERLDHQVREFEHRLRALFKPTPPIQRLLTLPGVGLTLAVVIALEVGDVARFATAEKLAAYE